MSSNCYSTFTAIYSYIGILLRWMSTFLKDTSVWSLFLGFLPKQRPHNPLETLRFVKKSMPKMLLCSSNFFMKNIYGWNK